MALRSSRQCGGCGSRFELLGFAGSSDSLLHDVSEPRFHVGPKVTTIGPIRNREDQMAIEDVTLCPVIPAEIDAHSRMPNQPQNATTVMDETEAVALLAREEARVRTLLTRLESGGLVAHTGLDEHLVPVEDRSLGGGAELAERELELGLLQSLESELQDVERARSRLQEGTYGRCATCREQIGIERLRAVPVTDRCMRHA